MASYFIITIDTEADNLWSANKITCENIDALRRFHQLSTSFGYPPTYLVSYEVLQSDRSINILKELLQSGNCEVGAHLHPWLTPPVTESDRKYQRYPSEIDENLLHEKMVNLTKEIEIKLGVSPRSYRAGRWGFNAVNAEVLKELNYSVDCSITPYLSWSREKGEKGGGPDYRKHTPKPFFIGGKEGAGIFEVPVSVFLLNEKLLKNRIIERFFFISSLSSIQNKIVRKLLLKPLWLRPFNTKDLGKFKTIYRLAQEKSMDVLQLAFHSSELMAGKNNLFKTKEDIEKLFSLFEEYFVFLSKRDVKGCTLSQYCSLSGGEYTEVLKEIA